MFYQELLVSLWEASVPNTKWSPLLHVFSATLCCALSQRRHRDLTSPNWLRVSSCYSRAHFQIWTLKSFDNSWQCPKLDYALTQPPDQIPVSYPSIVHWGTGKVITRKIDHPTFYSAGFLCSDYFLPAPLSRVFQNPNNRFSVPIPSSTVIVDTLFCKTSSSIYVAILSLVIVTFWLPGPFSTFTADFGSWYMIFSFLRIDTIHHTLLHTSHILAPSLVLVTVSHNSISNIHFSLWLPKD